ncbi:TPA: hypothetical protein N0F65_002497 [Lagenidium giganteum]|uniref:Dihydrolipoamide acetyltransferase component of pyruvate dehydrogenase complex n=1 Tax=Lagenidium giganteum TaxID=4803 RepID=A0AAV2YXA7_9STRA|nr:TPA: hypothetical protein N0F65_002497 [Lagenidium giganteum]
MVASSEVSSGSGANALHLPRKVGHLYQKSGLSRSWKPRYFTLEGTVLYYYKREGDAVPKGTVVLTGCSIKLTKDKKYYSFRISHPKTSKVYDLAATLQSRTEEWVELLQDAANPVFSQVSRSDSHDSRMSTAESTRSMSIAVDASELEFVAAEDAQIPAEHKDHLEALMCEFVKQAKKDADGWKLAADSRDVKAYTKMYSKVSAFKGVGVINHHPHAILRQVLDVSKRSSYDPQLLATRRAHVFDDHTFIDYLIYKPVFPAVARDFVNVTHWRVLQDDSIVVIATSVQRPDLCPSREPEVVRAVTHMGGFLIAPNADYTGATVTYIAKADVKAGVPAALQTKVFIKQAFVVDGLRKALDEEHFDNATFERVSNTTAMSLTTTELEEDVEEAQSSGDVADDEDDAASTHAEAETVPEEGFPAVAEKFADTIDKLIARMDVELNDESAWNFHSEKNGLKAYTKVDGSLTAAKGVGFVPFHPRAIWDAVIDINKKKLYDGQLATGHRLQTLDDQTCVDYLEYKPVFVVAGRDFVNLVHWRVLPGGAIIIVAQGIEDLSLAPLKEPKIVRGDVHLAGWKIVPNAAYDGADVSFMVKSDLKGSIPSRIASKAAAEQPYMIQRIADLLKKSKNLAELEAQGKVKNTIFELPRGGAKSSPAKPVAAAPAAPVAAPAKPAAPTTVAAKKEEASAAPVKQEGSPDQFNGDFDVLGKPKRTTHSPLELASYAFQMVVALLALKSVGLPSVLHYGVIGYLIVYFGMLLSLGPSHMSPRRRLMIATFGPPDSGMINGSLFCDVTQTMKYIDDKRAETDAHITLTHVVIRALGAALAKAPSVNGHIVFGNYYPSPTVDVSCLVAMEGGKDLGIVKVADIDKTSLKDLCTLIRGKATDLRKGKVKEHQDRNKLINLLPTWVIRPALNLCGWLGGACGFEVKAVGVERYQFGSVLVTSVGMMGLDLAFAPISPFAQCGTLVMIGSVKDTPVVVDGEIVVRKILTVTCTIDHRYVDGSQAIRMANNMKRFIEDPSLVEALAN